MADGEFMPLSVHVPGFLAARGYAPTSLYQRRSILRHLVTVTGDIPARDFSPAHAFMWWGSIAHLSPASRQAHLSGVRQYVAHLIALDLLDADPTATIKRPHAAAKPPVTLTIEQVLRFIGGLTTVRDRAAASLMLGCGLRVSDVTSLNVEDIDMAQRILRVRGKGGKVRLCAMPLATIECVSDLLRIYPADNGAVIRTRDGRRLNTQTLRVCITQALYDAEIKRYAFDGRSSHVLRRTCATMLLESGASIREVQAVMGHESIATTQAYLALPDTQRLIAVVERGPLSRGHVAA